MKQIEKRDLEHFMQYMTQHGMKKNNLSARWNDEEMKEGVRNKLELLPEHVTEEIQIVEVGAFYALRIHEKLTRSKNSALIALWLVLAFFRINGFEVRTSNHELLMAALIIEKKGFTEGKLSDWFAAKISVRAL